MNREYADEISTAIGELKKDGRYRELNNYIQHGTVSVFKHCRNVAYVSLLIADRLHIRVDRKALVKGALLHDYFLYDWHEKRKGHHFHGFTHPGTALKNAEKEYELGDIERNIISRHMFPLTVVPRMCREAWLVCLADKYCAVKETFTPSAGY